MRLGCFGFQRQMEDIKKIGFSNAELDLNEIVAMSEEEFDDFCAYAKKLGLSYDIFAALIPLTVRFHAKDFEEEYWMDHVAKAAKRAKALGAKIIPLGAGKCRSIPEDCEDREEAEEKVAHIVDRICGIYEPLQIDMVIEPLGPANSNYLNTIEETVTFIQTRVHAKNCFTMCDMRHMYKNKEDYREIGKYKEWIKHAHIDYPRGMMRYFPKFEDDYDYQPYFDALKEAEYDRILAIEATEFTDFYQDAKEGYDVIQECAKKAGIIVTE